MKFEVIGNLAAQLRDRRIQLGLSQAQVAEMLGVDQSCLSGREVHGFGGGTLAQHVEWAEVLEMELGFTLSANEQHPLPGLSSANRRRGSRSGKRG